MIVIGSFVVANIDFVEHIVVGQSVGHNVAADFAKEEVDQVAVVVQIKTK